MSVTVPAILKYLSNDSMNFIKEEDRTSTRAKKRRLDHLTWEEKVQRKKLKNRVAAQTSRDRKKAKMEEMEQALQELFYKNEELIKECKELRATNKKLNEENSTLRNVQNTCKCDHSRVVESGVQQGSAASIPLPKGRDTYSTAALRTETVTALWKIVLACLLYQTCSMDSNKTLTSTLWKNLPRASCRISPQTWRLLLKRQIVKNQSLVEKNVAEQWWGRHQKNWNPVDVLV
uniref:X-box-binding protein 1 n=1 Tax=Photinus pyralis TaxID=7054 RepID=A0A1Y1M654_PHOPY